jgi:hypothetical protein
MVVSSLITRGRGPVSKQDRRWCFGDGKAPGGRQRRSRVGIGPRRRNVAVVVGDRISTARLRATPPRWPT